MIKTDSFTLKNGLKVLLHEDINTPFLALNLMYKIGSANESSSLTGIAHFLEHMFFTGTENFPNFDASLQIAGGDANAYTSSDVTSYYSQIPAKNAEVLLALEADRMQHLNFKENAFNREKKVIIEEFKEQYLMQPFGNMWHIARKEYYGDDHPYSWLPIGKSLEHIQNIQLDNLIDFYHRFYHPQNACLALAGNLPLQTMKEWVKRYFNFKTDGKMSRFPKIAFTPQKLDRKSELFKEDNVSEMRILWNIAMPPLFTKDYYIAEFWLHYFNSEEGSPLYDFLVNEMEWATEVFAYHSESIAEGIFTLEIRGAELENLENIRNVLTKKIRSILENGISKKILLSILNKIQTALLFEELSIENKAHNMAFYGLLNKSENLISELNNYKNIHFSEINAWGQTISKNAQHQVLYYIPKYD
ncbi:MAG TPA: pitrilysin family protein [Chitinophagaceae bacterium]|nr:pitrilysin family protein [Chitinophagaceae bacterium]